MQHRSVLLTLALLCIVFQCHIRAADVVQARSPLASGPPLLKTNWTIINTNATTDGYSYPRVASFSSGNYIVIFGYSAPNRISVAQMRIYNATDGTYYISEAQSSIDEVGSLTAQNIYVFPNDRFARGVWQVKGLYQIMGRTVYEDPRQQSYSFNVFNQTNIILNATDYVDMAGSDWTHNVVSCSGETDASYFRYSSPEIHYGPVAFNVSFPSGAITHSTISQKEYNNYPLIYTLILLPDSGFYSLRRLNVGTVPTFMNDTLVDAKRGIPFVLDDLQIAAGLFVSSDGAIQLLVFDYSSLSKLYQFELAQSADSYFTPSVLRMSNNVVLVALSTSTKRIHYQMVKLSRTSAVLVGPQVTHDAIMTTVSVSMANTIGSDIVVVAKDVTGTQVMSRTITFCGNNALDLKEECDGSQGCMSDCKCQTGTLAVNGACIDQCQNGIVTGQEQCDSGTGCVECKCASGYRPTTPRSQSCEVVPKEFVPNVKPLFNCLETSNDIYTLHFSYFNNDGFDETVPHGSLNSFTPVSLGANRPSIFIAGQSLTYPLSPYSVDVPSDTSSVAWILTSYNLTVDLTDRMLLECPNSLDVAMTLTTFGNLTDELVHLLLQNIASKYNISESRLNASYTFASTDAQGLNTFVVVVTIDSSTTTSEQSSAGVVKELLGDLQTSKEETTSELTRGLEQVNPVIKTVTPSIIEPRGTTTPISVFTPNGLTSKSSTKFVLTAIILILCILEI